MARLVEPVTARKGQFLDSFRAYKGKRAMEVPEEVKGYCADVEKALASANAMLKRTGQDPAHGEVVYTRIANYGKPGGDKWWVVLLR